MPAESPRPGRSRSRLRHTDSAPRRGTAVSAPDDRDREIAALRARISALSAASLRISASLDLETVLNEVVESARALTGARFGAIATIDEAGVPQDFVTSGFTADEHRRLAEWSDGPRLFEYFRDLDGPLRIADVPAYVEELGFPTDRLPSKTFQGPNACSTFRRRMVSPFDPTDFDALGIDVASPVAWSVHITRPTFRRPRPAIGCPPRCSAAQTGASLRNADPGPTPSRDTAR